jgi:hypothetical protein
MERMGTRTPPARTSRLREATAAREERGAEPREAMEGRPPPGITEFRMENSLPSKIYEL